MPFKVDYNAEAGGIVMMGIVMPDEHRDFERQYGVALEQMRATATSTKRSSRGNWTNLFRDMIAYSTHFAPENNDFNLPDAYGFKDATVRMWRAISQASFVDAKQNVEAMIKGTMPQPDGREFGDVPEDAMAEGTRLFDEAKTKANA